MRAAVARGEDQRTVETRQLLQRAASMQAVETRRDRARAMSRHRAPKLAAEFHLPAAEQLRPRGEVRIGRVRDGLAQIVQRIVARWRNRLGHGLADGRRRLVQPVPGGNADGEDKHRRGGESAPVTVQPVTRAAGRVSSAARSTSCSPVNASRAKPAIRARSAITSISAARRRSADTAHARPGARTASAPCRRREAMAHVRFALARLKASGDSAR